MITIYVFVHLGACWQVYSTLHALFQGEAAHVILIGSRLTDLSVDTACRLAELVILEGHEAGIAWEVLTGPQVGSFGSVF